MRKHLYLVVESPLDDNEGSVRFIDSRHEPSEKNVETTIHKRNLETGETYTERIVSLGYYDFENEADYEDRAPDVMFEKLAEIDNEHIRNAGHDPAEVFGE